MLDWDSHPVNDAEQMDEIRTTLTAALRAHAQGSIAVARSLPRRHRHFPIETRVSFAVDETNRRTVMRLNTLDRPGLLAAVGEVFENCGVRLQNAKIATVGAEVDDVVFITAPGESPILSESAPGCLSREIHARLEGHA